MPTPIYTPEALEFLVSQDAVLQARHMKRHFDLDRTVNRLATDVTIDGIRVRIVVERVGAHENATPKTKPAAEVKRRGRPKKPPSDPDYEVEAAVFAVLQAAGKRLTRAKIMAALAEAGKGYTAPMVSGALTKMAKTGALEEKRGRVYGVKAE